MLVDIVIQIVEKYRCIICGKWFQTENERRYHERVICHEH